MSSSKVAKPEADRVDVVEGAKRKLSRKGFLFSSAGVLGASAHETELGYTDREILNYALTLEHLEAAFYYRGVPRFRR